MLRYLCLPFKVTMLERDVHLRPRKRPEKVLVPDHRLSQVASRIAF